jgi:glycosyltransferase involved in cell wall biosynthesis
VRPLRVAICFDFPEEQWRSMDRVAAELVQGLRRNHAGTIEVTPLVPRFVRRAGSLGSLGRGRTGLNIDRVLNRLWDYPQHVGAITGKYDVFHVIDHSYSQLVHRLPPGRTVVTCHDLDTFRSVLRPADEPRPWLFKAMTRHVLAGLQRATRVTCDTAAVRDELTACGIVPADRAVVARVGVGPDYSSTPDPDRDCEADRLIGAPNGSVVVLHVGSTIPRKRIDVLLKICGQIRHRIQNLHLVRIGGDFTSEQRKLVREVGMDGRVSNLGFVDDKTLAAIYRRAALALLPSDREGFGLPLIEAMACGTPILASDLPVLKEVGGSVIEYCAPGSVPMWSTRVLDLLNERREAPERWHARREAGLARARRFSWAQFAARVAQVYRQVAAEADPMPIRTSA